MYLIMFIFYNNLINYIHFYDKKNVLIFKCIHVYAWVTSQYIFKVKIKRKSNQISNQSLILCHVFNFILFYLFFLGCQLSTKSKKSKTNNPIKKKKKKPKSSLSQVPLIILENLLARSSLSVSTSFVPPGPRDSAPNRLNH